MSLSHARFLKPTFVGNDLMKNCLVGALGCMLMVTSPLVGEEQVIEVDPIDSVRYYSQGFGTCCSLQYIEHNPVMNSTQTCETMGGYCMSGRRVAIWLFPVPDVPKGSELTDVRFLVNKQSGGSGTGTIYMVDQVWDALGSYAASLVWGSPSHTQDAYFSSMTGHSFLMPIEHFAGPDLEPYLAVGIYRSSAMGLYNTGNMAPRLVFTFESPDTCPGDFNDDGIVNGADLSFLLGFWGMVNAEYDLDQSGLIDGADLAILLGYWGRCPR